MEGISNYMNAGKDGRTVFTKGSSNCGRIRGKSKQLVYYYNSKNTLNFQKKNSGILSDLTEILAVAG